MPKATKFTKKEMLNMFKLKSKCKPSIKISKILKRSKRGIYQVHARNDFISIFDSVEDEYAEGHV